MSTKEQELKEALEQIKALVKNVEGKIEALKLEKEDKFAELKEAYKNGAVIQFRNVFGVWEDVVEIKHIMYDNLEYRIKPEDKFADLKEAYKNGADIEYFQLSTNTWCAVYGEPLWDIDVEYRVKPEDKFAELKEAHKNGSTIHYKWGKEWRDTFKPKWHEYIEYRIKPEEEKPQIGDVCKFWSWDEDVYCVCVLAEVDKSDVPYKNKQGRWHRNAKKLTKEEAIELLFGKEENND